MSLKIVKMFFRVSNRLDPGETTSYLGFSQFTDRNEFKRIAERWFSKTLWKIKHLLVRRKY